MKPLTLGAGQLCVHNYYVPVKEINVNDVYEIKHNLYELRK